MSSGVFSRSKYETNLGVVVAIRVQPETIAATLGGAPNAAPADDITTGYPRATVSKSRRSVGIHARMVTIAFTTPPTGYAVGQTHSLPVLTEAVWDGLAEGVACTYLGVAATVVSVTAEKVR